MNIIGEQPDDSKLYVEFYQGAEQSLFQSEEKGYPVFVDKVYCKIIIPGDTQQVVVTEATDIEKRRFHRQWAAFQQGIESPQEGFPLEEWAAITRGQAETLKALKYRTVEHVANASDGQLQRIMGGYELRAKAQAFLAAAKDNAAAQKQAVENERMQKRIEELEEQIRQIAAPRGRKVKNDPIGDSSDSLQ